MRRLLFLLTLPLLAFAQLDDDTITVTASRRVAALPPDQVSVVAIIISPPETTLDEVLASLSGSGIKGTDLTSAQPLGQSGTQWAFAITVPLTKLKETLGGLPRVDSTSRWEVIVSLNLQSTAQQDCVYTALVSDARAHAQKLAAAAGLNVGAVVSLSDSPLVGSPGLVIPVLVQGNFSSSPWFNSATLYAPGNGASLQSCSMTVQFKLVR